MRDIAALRCRLAVPKPVEFAWHLKGLPELPKQAAYKSVVSLSGGPRIFQRGGARTHLARATGALSDRDVANLCQAISRAGDLGVPLNRMVTIHWERAGIAPGPAVATATAQFLKNTGDLVRRWGHAFAYVWIRENDQGDGSKGDHVHILCHVPPGRSLGTVQRGWIKRITRSKYRAHVIDTRRIGGTANVAATNPDLYAVNLIAAAEYVLKGIRYETAAGLGLARWGDGGRVVGKRIGVSRTLSVGVRKICC